jgi:predicted DNA-binding protein with PD1-like motif
MHYKLIEEQPKTYVLIFDTGNEIASGLKRFASELKLSASSFKAIGAFPQSGLTGLIGTRRNTNLPSCWRNSWSCFP